MILFNEVDVLDKNFRAKVIKEIQGQENQKRKAEQFKRYEVYHDMVSKYTEDLLLSQFDQSTVEEMRISLTNVSICRKIIDKLARVYSSGVERKLERARDQKKLEELERLLKFNSKMKKANRYLKLHKNIWVMCLPKPYKDLNGEPLYYDLKISILPPFLFDVIEDGDDRECAKALIISNYNPKSQPIMYDSPERLGKRGFRTVGINSFAEGDGVDQIIADTPDEFDKKHQKFTWWTKNFHMVTDEKGEIIGGPADLVNPVGVIPGIALNMDQDGNYYSKGGNDLVDSCILANAMLTNINHIGIQQGYGQAFIKGKDLPEQIKLGPTKVVKLQTSADGEETAFGFATSNAPIQDLKEITVTQIALLLSTNNLSTSGVKVNLDGGSNFPSGIAMMIDKSESTEDVHDQAQIFLDEEPHLWEIAQAWIDVYKKNSLISDDLKELQVDVADLKLKIHEPKTIISEGEKLDNIQKRKDLGINTMVELIKIDNPELTEEEAAAKLLAITEEKQKQMLEMQALMEVEDSQQEEAEEEEAEETEEESLLNGKTKKPKEMEMMDA